MSKRPYYVAIHSGEKAGALLQEKSSDQYVFEIEATPEEARELSYFLEQLARSDIASFWNAHTPFIQDKQNPENEQYDSSLVTMYEHIHRLGTPETKEQIESMNILEQ
ncbi:hypothetical protein [Marininema halotolerans]|uniref:Hydrolase n=1 Tax=Marininema halotolerans TaxID=1155944 RepID=A0A1I6UJY3_9BACL|nr:hypothetical protein [Marininema halotolerans]SFT01738.1 hypothetical protein SAMN05444972_11723 [Marininema halotolerans]